MASDRRVERLVTAARRKSHNTRFGTNEGLATRLALEYLNDGARHIFSKIVEVGTDLYTKEAFISTISGTAEYDFPSRIFYGGKIVTVQYSYSGIWTQNAYFTLNGPISEDERCIYHSVPREWLIRNGQIILSPIPDATIANGIRIIYREEPPTLDIRRGLVHEDTDYNPSTGVLTMLVMDPAETPFDTNSLILDEDWVNIVDKDGNFLMRNIGQVTALDTTLGTITFDSDFRGTSTETAPEGAFITSGWNATTHSPYDHAIDDYLIDYAVLWMSEYDHDDISFAKKEKKLMLRERDIVMHHASLGLGEGFIRVPR